MAKKVFLRQSTADLCYICDDNDYEYVELNDISTALTQRFWSQWSPTPLKSWLIKHFGSIRNMYLKLDVACEKHSAIVKSIALKCALRDGDDRSWIIGCIDEMDWESIQECTEEYFQSIGYDRIECTNDEDIVNFVERLEQDVPLVKEYFKVLYKYNENIARIGYLGDNDEYEIFVETDDEETTPHFHMRDTETQGERFETCVCFEANRYCLHGKHKDVLTPELQAQLWEYMGWISQYKLYKLPFIRNYEWAADMWNLNNEATQVTLRYDSGDDVIIPDYSKMSD